jgi:hypothetical protein
LSSISCKYVMQSPDLLFTMHMLLPLACCSSWAWCWPLGMMLLPGHDAAPLCIMLPPGHDAAPWAWCCPPGHDAAPRAWSCCPPGHDATPLGMMLSPIHDSTPWAWCCPLGMMLPPWAWCCPLGHYAAFLLSCACWSPIGMMLRPKNINSTLAPMDHYFDTKGFFLMRGVATCGS